jgi:hypothetical protein
LQGKTEWERKGFQDAHWKYLPAEVDLAIATLREQWGKT